MPVLKDIVLVAVIDGGAVHSVQTNAQAVQYFGFTLTGTGAVPPGLAINIPGGSDTLTVSITGMGPAVGEWLGSVTYNVGITGNLGGPGITEDLRIHLRAIPRSFLLVDGATNTLQMPEVPGFPIAMVAGGGVVVATDNTGGSFDLVKNGDPWGTADAEFDLTLTLYVTMVGGTVASTSTFTTPGQRPIRALRQRITAGATPVTGYTWMELQSAGGTGVDMTLPAGTTVTSTPPATVTMDADLRLSAVGVSADTTFTLSFGLEGLLSVTTGLLNLHFRQLIGAGGTNAFDVIHTSALLSLEVDELGTPYVWDAFSATGGLLPDPTGALAFPGEANPIALDYTPAPLTPGENGTYEAIVRRADDAHPSSTIPVTVTALEVLQALTVQAAGGGLVLPAATELAAYLAQIDAINPSGLPGPTYAWNLSAAPAVTSILSLAASSGASVDVETTLGTPIPSAWFGAADKVLTVSVTESIGAIQVGFGTADLTLHTDQAPALIDTAILLDRSGSMVLNNRWTAAVSGARAFADLVRLENLASAKLHTVAVLWFGGWGNSTDANYDAALPAPHSVALPGVPHGGDNFGRLLVAPPVDAGKLDFLPPDAAYLTDIDSAGTSNDTPFWTALGSGLLHARDRLVAQPATHQRVLLCLSDGEENRPPLVTTDLPALWGSPSPKVNVYGIAVETGPAGVASLEAAAALDGGPGATNVKNASPYNAAEVQGWFEDRFVGLFGWTVVTALVDPAIDEGATEVHDVEMNLADGMMVFTAFLNEPPPTVAAGKPPAWQLALQPPGPGAQLITEDEGGVSFSEGSMYRRVAVKLPLAIAGHEHRWGGTWKVHVTCNVDGGSSYAPTAIKRAFDPSNTVDRPTLHVAVAGAAALQPNVDTKVLAWVAQNGQPLADAHVRGVIVEPPPWPGALLADTIKEMKAWGDLKPADQVHGSPVEQALAALIAEGELPSGPTRGVNFQYTPAGVFEATVALPEPGTYRIHVTADGKLKAPKFEADELKAAVKALHKHYKGQELQDEMDALNLSAGPVQRFHLEQHVNASVPFVPARKTSNPYGRMLGKGAIRLTVRPRSADGSLLGPGWAHAIQFFSPRGPHVGWDAIDGGAGTYYVTIPMRWKGSPVLKERGTILWAKGIAFESALGWGKLGGSRLRLDRFSVTVLGMHMPIHVLPVLSALPARSPFLASYVERFADAHALGRALAAGGSVRLPEHALDSFKRVTEGTLSLLRPDLAPTQANMALAKLGVRIAQERLRTAADALSGTPVEDAMDALTDAVSELEQRYDDHGAACAQLATEFFREVGAVRDLVQTVAGAVDDDCGGKHSQKAE